MGVTGPHVSHYPAFQWGFLSWYRQRSQGKVEVVKVSWSLGSEMTQMSLLCILLAKGKKKSKTGWGNSFPPTDWKSHSAEDMNSGKHEELQTVLQSATIIYSQLFILPKCLSGLSLSQDFHKPHIITIPHWKSKILWLSSSPEPMKYMKKCIHSPKHQR